MKRIVFLLALLVATVIATIIYWPESPKNPLPKGYSLQDELRKHGYSFNIPPLTNDAAPAPEPQPEVYRFGADQAPAPAPQLFNGLKTRFSGFSDAEKAKFEKDFQEKYQPAIQKFSKVYEGRLPFDPYDVTTDQFVERIGRQERYRQYIFVVNGITLGIDHWAETGDVRVGYLNAPQQTRKMAMVPDGGLPPVVTSLPVTREQVQATLQADGGLDPNDKMDFVPSGLSGSLNGGVIVNVGPDPENAATYNYSLVFGPDGKLAFYLKGHASMVKASLANTPVKK